jgi:hypothetical protein
VTGFFVLNFDWLTEVPLPVTHSLNADYIIILLHQISMTKSLAFACRVGFSLASAA